MNFEIIKKAINEEDDIVLYRAPGVYVQAMGDKLTLDDYVNFAKREENIKWMNDKMAEYGKLKNQPINNMADYFELNKNNKCDLLNLYITNRNLEVELSNILKPFVYEYIKTCKNKYINYIDKNNKLNFFITKSLFVDQCGCTQEWVNMMKEVSNYYISKITPKNSK
jgi:hypothetical protein